MLADKELKAFVPTVKPGEARSFYKDILGLKLLSEDNYALEFDANGTLLRVTIVQDFKPQVFTILGWNVADIVSVIKSLNDKGIMCEKYAFLTGRPWHFGYLPEAQKLHGLKTLMVMCFH